MTGFRIGVMHNTINSRFGPKPLIQADYMTGLAAGADSFWVADHLNSVLPPSMWKPKYVGAAKIIPKMDAHVEPWTMLGYLAGHNKIGRMTLGVAVTDTGRRNPAVTAQAAVTLQHLTRGRAILGIGTGEREGNEPYGVEWSKPVGRFEEAVATIRALWDIAQPRLARRRLGGPDALEPAPPGAQRLVYRVAAIEDRGAARTIA